MPLTSTVNGPGRPATKGLGGEPHTETTNPVVFCAAAGEIAPTPVADFDAPTGKGAIGTVAGKRVALGNAAFLSELNIATAGLNGQAEELRHDGATAIFVALGRVDTVALRLANATLGALVALMASVVAARFVSQRAALVAGLVVGVWPTLILWSATFLRDTLASFVVVAVWWTLVYHQRVTQPRVLGVVALALVVLTSLRPYLAGAVALGVIAWAVVPLLAGRSKRSLAIVGVAFLVARRQPEE